MNSGAPEVTPTIREVWQLVRAHAKKDLRRVAVALVPPHAPGVRAYFADGSQRDYRYVGGLLEDVPGGFESWPPPPYVPTPNEGRGVRGVKGIRAERPPLTERDEQLS